MHRGQLLIHPLTRLLSLRFIKEVHTLMAKVLKVRSLV